MIAGLTKNGGPASGSSVLITDTTSPFDCADASESTGPLTLTPLAGDHDEDGDGNPDYDELGDDELCGLRDPFNPYDYYDVASAGGVPVPDGVIDLANDITGVINHYAPSGGGNYDPHYDREPHDGSGYGHWNRYGIDGVIDLANDILGVNLQYNPAGCGGP